MAKLSVFNKNLLETFTAVGDMNIPGYDAFFGALSQGNAEKLGQSLIAIFQNYRKANETIEDFKAKYDGEEPTIIEAIKVDILGEEVTFTADKIADVVAEKANLEEILANKDGQIVEKLQVSYRGEVYTVDGEEVNRLYSDNGKLRIDLENAHEKIKEQDGRLVTAQRHIEESNQKVVDLETQLDKVSGDYKVLHDEYVVAGGKKLRPHDPHFDNKRERMNPLYAADVTSQFGKGIKIDPTASMPATPHLEGLKQNTFAQYSLMVFADGEASVLVDALQMSIKHGLTLVIDLTNEPMGNNLHISQLHVNL